MTVGEMKKRLAGLPDHFELTIAANRLSLDGSLRSIANDGFAINGREVKIFADYLPEGKNHLQCPSDKGVGVPGAKL